MERNDENSRNLTPFIDFFIDDIRNVVVVVVVVAVVAVVVVVVVQLMVQRSLLNPKMILLKK